MSDSTSRESEALAESLKGNGELILLVDDEPSILRVTAMVLDKQNYRVLCATNGSEALAVFALQMDSVKAVLTDIMLPSMDGIELIRAIKEMKPEMVFIASTGRSEQLRLRELQELGVTNLLTKPYDRGSLLMTLRDALESSV
jgi:CheY-like chemotaxis protein